MKRIKKRYKDYPQNVPRKLFKMLKECSFNRSKLALNLQVNSGYLSQLLNDGIEPTDKTATGRYTRKKLFLKVHKEGRTKSNRTKQKIERPEFIRTWNHLPKEERHQVIQQYLKWKETNKNERT